MRAHRPVAAQPKTHMFYLLPLTDVLDCGGLPEG